MNLMIRLFLLILTFLSSFTGFIRKTFSPGNTFIFAHSAGNWYQASQYNAVFYLLNKLSPGDDIILYYQSQPYSYQVDQVKLVSNQELDYLISATSHRRLTLMTCWPPGTTLKRLIVIASPKN